MEFAESGEIFGGGYARRAASHQSEDGSSQLVVVQDVGSSKPADEDPSPIGFRAQPAFAVHSDEGLTHWDATHSQLFSYVFREDPLTGRKTAGDDVLLEHRGDGLCDAYALDPPTPFGCDRVSQLAALQPPRTDVNL